MKTKNVDYTKTGINTLIQQYQSAAEAHGEATMKGDYRKGNSQADIIAAIYRELRSRGEAAQRTLLVLLDNPNDAVRAWAAAHALQFAPEEGEPVLKLLAKTNGLVGLDAEMTLREWRKGNLKFP